MELWPDADVEDRRLVSGDTVRNVTRPTLTRFGPGTDGPAVLIAPGGGMHLLSIAGEGSGLAELLAAQGIPSYVLEYRLLPTPVDDTEHLVAFGALLSNPADLLAAIDDHRPTALLDGQEALRQVRARQSRVAMIGFSAGGIVTSDVLMSDDKPDAAALVYTPFMTPAEAGPPLFVLATADDPFGTGGSTDAYAVWQRGGRPVELHLYPQGGHGFGVTKTGFAVDAWTDLLLAWLRSNGF
jgi:acetyl esterase/lipase